MLNANLSPNAPLFVSLDRMQNIRKIVFYLVIYVFIEKEKLFGIKYILNCLKTF